MQKYSSKLGPPGLKIRYAEPNPIGPAEITGISFSSDLFIKFRLISTSYASNPSNEMSTPSKKFSKHSLLIPLSYNFISQFGFIHKTTSFITSTLLLPKVFIFAPLCLLKFCNSKLSKSAIVNLSNPALAKVIKCSPPTLPIPGIERFNIADFDNFELKNFNRQ